MLRFARVGADRRFDARQRVGVDDALLDLGDLLGSEGGIADEGVERGTVIGGERLAGVGDEQRALEGLPVTAVSPKTPRTSSLSWNASPSG